MVLSREPITHMVFADNENFGLYSTGLRGRSSLELYAPLVRAIHYGERIADTGNREKGTTNEHTYSRAGDKSLGSPGRSIRLRCKQTQSRPGHLEGAALPRT